MACGGSHFQADQVRVSCKLDSCHLLVIASHLQLSNFPENIKFLLNMFGMSNIGRFSKKNGNPLVRIEGKIRFEKAIH